MKTAAGLLLLALAAGCAHSTVNAGSSGTGASVSLHASGHGLAALVAAGVLFIAVRSEESGAQPYPPAMDPGRRINAQDCTRPIDESAGNLKCR